MLTKNLIKEIEKLRFVVKKSDSKKYLWVKDSSGSIVAFVDTTEMYVVDTAHDAFERLQESDKKNLLDLLVKYARTPTEDRKEPERFYLKFEALTDNGSGTYLNYYKSGDSLGMSTCSQSFGFQTQFTQKEIDEIKEKFGVTLSDFRQIPVDEYWEEDED